jgi:hypothetical protein
MIREDFKSQEEYYFYLYCEELKDAGFIKEIEYESSTFDLCKPYSRRYLQQLKTKIVQKEEYLLHKSSITADFTIKWTEKAINIFVLDSEIPILCNVKDIPFRASESIFIIPYSLIEVKPTNESTITSSISFPLKQKQLQRDYGLYIQKIKPFDLKKKCLFYETFVPKKVSQLEVYKRLPNVGETKFKYKTRTLEEYLKLREYAKNT